MRDWLASGRHTRMDGRGSSAEEPLRPDVRLPLNANIPPGDGGSE